MKPGPKNKTGINWGSGDETEKQRFRIYQRSYKTRAGEKYKRIQRNSQLKQYGISLEEYEKLFENQNGVCAICLNPPGNKMLSVDHCHNSGKIRGLLCHTCNSGIGMFKENKTFIKRAWEYL
jgi:hypothetical protein